MAGFFFFFRLVKQTGIKTESDGIDAAMLLAAQQVAGTSNF